MEDGNVKEEKVQDEEEPMNVVTIEAPYRDAILCKYCGRKFTIIQNLRRHMKNQHLGFRYSCLSCSSEVTRREDIIRHYLSFHPTKMEEAYSIREVCKKTEDGKVKPMRRASRQSSSFAGALRIKKSRREKEAKPGLRPDSDLGVGPRPGSEEQKSSPEFRNQEVISTESVPTTTTENLGRSQGPDNQRVVIALDPVTQFRLERVVSERVDRVTEKSVVETLNKSGRVIRRETIEREYFLKN